MTAPVDGAARRTVKTGRRVLWVVSAMLLASAGLRIAAGYGPARALGTGHAATAAADEHAAPAACTQAPDVAALLEQIAARGAQLDARDQGLAERQATLDVAEREIRANLSALQAAEAALQATMTRAETAAEDDLARLTSVYENMKAKDAAALFETMAPEFAAGFLGRMRSDAAAGVLAGLSPQSAYAISVILAGRNANAPTQ